jgi:hypothetical protein
MSGLVVSQSIGDQFYDFGVGIANGATTVFKNIKLINADSNNFSRVIRVVGYIFALFMSTAQAKFRGVMSLTDEFVGAAQTFCSLQNLTEKTKSEDNPVLKKFADASYLVAGVGSIALFTDTIKLTDLSSVSTSTGILSYLGSNLKEIVSNVTTAAVGLACILLGVNASIKLANAIDEINNAANDKALLKAQMKRNESILDLAFCVAEVAFCALAIFQVAAPAVLIVVGIVAAGLGIASFLYSKHREAEVKKLN